MGDNGSAVALVHHDRTRGRAAVSPGRL